MGLECRLKYVLLDIGWDQSKLSEVTGISRTTITRIANGKVHPMLETSLIISEAVGKPVNEIWAIKKSPD